MSKQLSETELATAVAKQIELAKSHDKSERLGSRTKALDYFMGDMDKYVPPEPNRSKVVSRDVADTMGWIMPDIMRSFTASGRMAEAEPVGGDDDAFADEATDGLNYVFWKDNKGYEIVYNASWNSLLLGNGIVKTFYDDTPVYKTSFHSGLTEDQAIMLVADDDVEVLAVSEDKQEITDENGQPTAIKLFDLKIKRKQADGKFIIEAVPPEEFLKDKSSVSIDDAPFTAHWQRKTRSELVAMGYEKEKVWDLPDAGSPDTPEAAARDAGAESTAADKATQEVDYYECYIRIDVDSDGEAELVRACYGGGQNGTLLDWEVWEDENPFDDIPCNPVPHRFDAQSIADETMDIQDVKTVLSRQLLNNTYWVNNPQRFVQGKIENPEQLSDPDFGGTVFGAVGSSVTPLPVPYIGDKALAGIGYMDEVAQRRTGVGRQSMALDPDVLQNQTATASNNNKDAARSQSELLARNMAEWGWKKVFRKLLRLMVRHQKQPRTLRMNRKRSVTIDPRHWNADMDITVNVGLGTGSRERDLAMLGNILQSQLLMADRFMAASAFDDAIDMLPKILRTMVKMAEAAGIRNPEDFYPEYTEEKVAQLKQLAQAKQSQPDPKVQADIQKMQAQLQASAQESQARLSLDAQRMQSEFSLKQQQLEAEIQLKREQLSAELELKREQMAAEMQLKRELGALGAMNTGLGTSAVNMGGDPG